MPTSENSWSATAATNTVIRPGQQITMTFIVDLKKEGEKKERNRHMDQTMSGNISWQLSRDFTTQLIQAETKPPKWVSCSVLTGLIRLCNLLADNSHNIESSGPKTKKKKEAKIAVCDCVVHREIRNSRDSTASLISPQLKPPVLCRVFEVSARPALDLLCKDFRVGKT